MAMPRPRLSTNLFHHLQADLATLQRANVEARGQFLAVKLPPDGRSPTVGSNPEARADAILKVKAFLAANFEIRRRSRLICRSKPVLAPLRARMPQRAVTADVGTFSRRQRYRRS